MEIETVELKNTLPAKAAEYEKAIADLQKKYGKLELTDLSDKQTYEVIKKARIDVKNTRVGVQKYCKQERDVANAYIKANTSKEKEILALLQPLEDKLIGEEAKYEAEQQRIKDEIAERERQKLAARIQQLKTFGATRDEDNILLAGLRENVEHISLYSDEQFSAVCEKFAAEANRIKLEKEEAELKAQQERERIAKIQAEQKAEAERLEAIRLEQEAEHAKRLKEVEKQQREADELRRQVNERVAAEQEQREREAREKQRAIDAQNARIAAELKAREDAVRAEQEKIEAEKRRVVEEENQRIEKERRAKELEQARKEAAEKALKEAEQKRIADEKAKAAADKLAAEKEAARIARQPDKEKLKLYADSLCVELPKVKSKEAQAILDEAINQVNAVRKYINNELNKL